MANFTLETNRNTAIQAIPRITFQLPQSTSGSVASTTTPIYFCQTGCQLEFQFNNITGAQLKNDGNYFTIIPTGNSNNYINWNGSGASGQNMIRFDLKEIKFSAPARDVVGSITYNKSIQFYFTFVNSTYPNIMIVITIIGQSNNVGSAQTDGFVLLNALTNQIPLRNDVKTVSNLGNVNLGNLLPPNKSFFSTLINGNNIQYISMTRIIDIPESFLNNMISRVVGSQQAYTAKVNQYTQELPTNPQGTIIFYTENIKPINSDQAYVCNANCDRVVGDASLLQPTFGPTTTTRSAGASSSIQAGTVPPANIPQEVCEEEYVFPGTQTRVNIRSASTPSTSADTSSQKQLTPNEVSSSAVQAIVIVFLSIVIIGGAILILWFLAKATNISGIRSFFSRELWNISNAGWITIGLLGSSSIIIFTSVTLDLMIKEQNKPEEDNKKVYPWIFLIIGASIWIICFAILMYKARKYKSFSNMSNMSGISKYSPNRTLTYPRIPINATLPEFKGISALSTQASKILSDYQKSPDDFFKQSSQGRSDIVAASKQYQGLTQLGKDTLAKYNPSIVPFLNPSSEFMKNIKSKTNNSYPAQKTLISFIENLRDYNELMKNPAVVSNDLIIYLKELQSLKPTNSELSQIIQQIKSGNPIPIEVYKYLPYK